MVVGDYGVILQFGVGFDLSAFTGLTLNFTRPDGSTFTATNPAVSISATPITTPAGSFAGNQYALYTFKNGDITLAGEYTVRLVYTASGTQLTSEPVAFTVSA